MNCPNPRFARYYDGFTGECKTLRFGCGRCASCLKAEQDSWSIRLQETAHHSDSFIYTTLTFAPSAFDDPMMRLDVTDAVADWDFLVSEDTAKLLDYWFSIYGYGQLPLFEKRILSDWIKRGRENYFADTGERLHFKYMFTSELGGKHSRPHAHGLLFGISYPVFKKYFEEPWQNTYGFTDSKFIAQKSSSSYHKSANCISRYVSKYITKGSFDSPLIKNGLIPKCWRMVSNGIGEEYLNSSRFDFTRSFDWQVAKELFVRPDDGSPSLSKILYRDCMDPNFYSVKPFRVPDSYTPDSQLDVPSSVSPYNPFDGIKLPWTLHQLKSLYIYVTNKDDKCFYFSCPRYYRDKLLGRTQNLLRYCVQNALLVDASKRRDTQIQAFATTLESSEACRDISRSYGWSISSSSRYLAALLVDSSEKDKACREEQRNFNNLKNVYTRPLRAHGKKRIVLTQ